MDIRQVFTAPSPSATDQAKSGDKPPEPLPFSPSERETPKSNISQSESYNESRSRMSDPSSRQTPAEQYFGEMVQPDPEIDVFTWLAPSRPFKNRQRKYYTTIGVIVLLISLILFFAGQFLPVAVVLAVAFVSYVMSTIPPEIITNKITTYGLRLDDQLYYWDDLGTFWFEKKIGKDVLLLEIVQFPYRIMFVLDNTSVEEIRDILSRVLIEKKPPLNSYEKAGKWLQEKFPLDLDDEEVPVSKPTTQVPPNNTPHPQ